VSRRLVLIAALNLVWLAAWIWANTERIHLTIEVSGDTATATVASTRVTAVLPGAAGHAVGLFLQGADRHAPVTWPAPQAPAPAEPSLLAELYRLSAESAWGDLQVTDGRTGRVVRISPGSTGWIRRTGDWFPHPFGGITTARPGLLTRDLAVGTTYRLDIDLLRPRNAAGVLVLSPDGVDGLLFLFRPEDRDAVWYRVADGQWQGPLAAAPFHAFRLDAVSGLQDVVRLLVSGYPFALILMGGVAVASRLGERTVRKRPAAVSGTASVGLPCLIRLARAAVPGPVRKNLPTEGIQRRTLAARLPLSPVDQPEPSRLSGRRPATSWSTARCPWSAPAVAAGAVSAIGLVVTLSIAKVVLEGMPHVQDSVAYLFQAKIFALGRLWAPLPPHPEFFAHEFIVMRDGRWFGKYPPGWPLLLALGVLAGAPWAVNPVCAALSLLVLYRLGREIYRPRIGLLASVLGITSPFLLFLSGSMMAHPSGLLFILLFAWMYWRATGPHRSNYASALAGAAIGMACLIRPYSALVAAFPFVVDAFLRGRRAPGDAMRRFVPMVVAAIPFVGAFLAYNAVFTGNPFYPTQQLWWPFDRVGFGPDHGPWGYTPIDALNNVSRNFHELLEHAFGWPQFTTLSLAALPFLSGRARRWDVLWAAGFLAVAAGYALWWADGIMYGPRFYYEGFGFLILLTARGVDVLLDIASPLASPVRTPVQWMPMGLVYLVVAGLVAFNAAFYFPGQWALYHGYNYVNHSKLDAVARAGIHHAVVFADVGQWYEWWEYGMVFSANDPLLTGDVIYARDLGDARDRELMADFPGRSFYRLKGTHLIPFPAASRSSGAGD